MDDRINEGFFLKEDLWPFCQAAKKRGRNNKVTYYQGGRKAGFHCN